MATKTAKKPTAKKASAKKAKSDSKATGKRQYIRWDYEEVAKVYNDAMKAKTPPTTAVANKFDVNRHTAASAVAKARSLGHIGKYVRDDWTKSKKVEAVAKELRVKPERLVEALRSKAGGMVDVRLTTPAKKKPTAKKATPSKAKKAAKKTATAKK